MSGIRDLSSILKAAYGQRNPLRVVYYRTTHKWIAKKLLSRGEKAYRPISLAKSDNLIHLPLADKQAIISLADKTMSGVYNLLGSGDYVLNPVEWSSDFIRNYEWKPGTYYRKYRQVDLDKHIDVKIPRELSRFHFLLHLALAYNLVNEERYKHKAKELIEDWIDNNPLMYSINWGCSMDVGIRAVNWIWAIPLLRLNDSDKTFEKKVVGSLYQHGWFIYRNMEGHCFRYNNNHYYSDLVGLLHIASYFKGDRQADEWYRFALSEFYRETRLQILPSGLDFECSTNYHRLVIELLTTTLLLLRRNGEIIPPDISSRCEKMFEVVYQMLMPDGTMPIVGDQDNGRCLPWGAESLNDYRYLMSLGAILFTRGDFKECGNGYNVYCAIAGDTESYSFYQHIKGEEDKRTSLHLIDAGFVIMRNKTDYLLYNVDNQGEYRDTQTTSSHTHSDWFSFVLCSDGVPFFIDPGTHVYSSNSDSRNLFRSTRMHNTVEIDGKNQSEVYDAKLWDMKRTGRIEDFALETTRECDFVTGIHTGYERLPHPVKTRRSVRYSKSSEIWEIEDELIGTEEHLIQCHFHLEENVKATLSATTCVLEKANVCLYVTFECSKEISVSLIDTFISKGYGDITGGKEIVVSYKGECPIIVKTIISKKDKR